MSSLAEAATRNSMRSFLNSRADDFEDVGMEALLSLGVRRIAVHVKERSPCAFGGPKPHGRGDTWGVSRINMLSHRFSVAPMMDWTDRHCRVFHRLLTRHTRLYTEMLTTPAIIHGDRARLLGFDASEHPVALQLGGSDPRDLAPPAKIGEDFGYDEINLNVGCPSVRVNDGRFGACLMAEPELVAASGAALKRAVEIPVTV